MCCFKLIDHGHRQETHHQKNEKRRINIKKEVHDKDHIQGRQDLYFCHNGTTSKDFLFDLKTLVSEFKPNRQIKLPFILFERLHDANWNYILQKITIKPYEQA